MKRFISVLLTFAIALSFFSGLTVFAAEKAVLIFEDNFDDNVLDLPQDWKFVVKSGEHYLQSKVAKGGKALYINDDTLGKFFEIHSKFIPVTAGETYSAGFEAFIIKGPIIAALSFYDINQKSIPNSGSNLYSTTENDWEVFSVVKQAPANAAYAVVKICTHAERISGGYVDNVTLYKGRNPKTFTDEMDPPLQYDPVNAKIIEPVGDKLQYNTYNDAGDKLSDFSAAGFYGGKYELPDSKNLPVAVELSPSKKEGTDDTKRIQAAIDEAFNNSPHNYMKVVKLKAGTYNINRNGLTLRSGIVLSGEGQGPTGTIIFATDPVQYNVIKINGSAPAVLSENAKILDTYIKAGSNQITIDPARIGDYKVGDLVAITHPSSKEWCESIGMANAVHKNGDDGSWIGKMDMITEKFIKEINGNTITFDSTFYVPYDTTLTECFINKIDESERIENAGVENLRILSNHNGDPFDENHATNGVMISNAINCYVRDVYGRHLLASTVSCNSSRQVTVKNCTFAESVSKLDGGRRYSFSLGNRAQQILVTGCYTYYGRHDYVLSNPLTGPVVFSDNVSDQAYLHSEPHGNWSTGVLYENIFCIGNTTRGGLTAVMRGYGASTGPFQGWAGMGIVFWNCLAPVINVNKPLYGTYNNFSVGQWGFYDDEIAKTSKEYVLNTARNNGFVTGSEYVVPENIMEIIQETSDKTAYVGNNYKESVEVPVEPRSLFKAQLAERLTGSIKNAKPNAPVITSPRGEEEYMLESNEVTFKGLYQKGAEKVTLYIDNQAYDATLDNKTYMFELKLELGNGTHKVHATQTIDGVEGTKCADRFVIIRNEGKNKDYLSSEYEREKISQITNDPRITFDEYQKEAVKTFVDNPIRVEVNGVKLITDVEPVEISGRVLVPMRAIFEKYDAEVNWDEATATATATRKGKTVSVTENSTVAKVNGNDVILDVPATIINGRFVVPVRFISESFGSDVGWIDARKTVVINHSMQNDVSNKLTIAKMIPSGFNSNSDGVDLMLDGNIKTSWAVSTKNANGSWLIIDMGETKNIKDLCFSFRDGLKRVYTFDILSSEDGENFNVLQEKVKSSGKTEDWEYFPVNTQTRYLKLLLYGYNDGIEWNNFNEIAITGN